MSSTRRAPDNAPLSQERYMSSPEYAELRGLSGNAVARKAAYLAHPRKKSLLFWLQAVSLRPGGLPKLAQEFVEASAHRIGTPTLLAHRLRSDDQCYPSDVADRVAKEVEGEYIPWGDDDQEEAKRRREWQRKHRSTTRAQWLQKCHNSVSSGAARLLTEVAINPKYQIQLPGEAASSIAREQDAFQSVYDYTQLSGFVTPSLDYFTDFIPALIEFQEQCAARVAAEFVHTNISREVFKTLDTALRRPGRIALLQGAAGVGKSEAVRTWAEMHAGEARMISLSGVSHKTGFFRAIARVLGLASSYTRTATEMQSRVEGVLQSSRLMVIIDEAQFAWSSGDRIYTQPEIINWTYSALANFNVPVALVATDQFNRKLRQAEQQVIWTGAEAFKRRLRPHVVLPAKPLAGEMMAIARKRMPGASEAAVKEIVGYAGATDYSLTNLVDAIQDAQEFATEAGRSHIAYEDARRAVSECREPSDAASKAAFRPIESGRGSRRRKAIETAFQAPLTQHSEAEKTASDEQDLPEQSGQKNARFSAAISGRTGRALLTA